MKHDGANNKNRILIHLSTLPQKILSLHGRADLAEFVLRDLCHERCFNLKKAAFFIDNPDFNHLKGIAGFCHEENPNCIKCPMNTGCKSRPSFKSEKKGLFGKK